MPRASFTLASASPRRRALLEQAGYRFAVRAAALDERREPGEAPRRFVERLALAKARAVSEQLGDGQIVLAADTAVVVGGEVLGKPVDRADGLRMLALLSGREHEVLTAVALCEPRGESRRLSCSRVRLRVISDAERAAYWDCGEPADKAGSYAIQGRAAIFVERLEGSYSGVMGLPLFEAAELLGGAGLAPAALWRNAP